MVIGGDLNFTLGVHEIWGPSARSDPLAAFFKTLLQNLKLVDLNPQNIKPTWSNKRTGDDSVISQINLFSLSSHKIIHFDSMKDLTHIMRNMNVTNSLKVSVVDKKNSQSCSFGALGEDQNISLATDKLRVM